MGVQHSKTCPSLLLDDDMFTQCMGVGMGEGGALAAETPPLPPPQILRLHYALYVAMANFVEFTLNSGCHQSEP